MWHQAVKWAIKPFALLARFYIFRVIQSCKRLESLENAYTRKSSSRSGRNQKAISLCVAQLLAQFACYDNLIRAKCMIATAGLLHAEKWCSGSMTLVMHSVHIGGFERPLHTGDVMSAYLRWYSCQHLSSSRRGTLLLPEDDFHER